jgi:hypothetical protein
MSDNNYDERLKSTGRNDPCLCGSGKKYKKCHLAEDETKRSAARKALEEQAIARTAENAEAEEESSPTDKTKRPVGRHKARSESKTRATERKPSNIPRRGAV